ncbi:30S ribosomal protein S1 [uncultured Algimonas sp.]|uniref:30S ribosomal protein S1 n=1 Tax=uncultured Algimonas sp. TaxID=1547920 RepID=UPI00344FDD99
MDETFNPSTDDFAAMFEASVEASPMREGKVVEGIVTGIEKDMAIVDIGLKTEGRIELREFYEPGSDNQLKVGDTVEVFLERIENALGQAVLSRDKARREESWVKMAKFHEDEEPVKGTIVGRVKGGFTVDLGGINAFLPGSQVDIRPVRDIGPLMGTEQPFQILKMDKSRGNIVVSRRAILEESRAEQRAELVAQLQEGEVREGVVKNITDYGAFVDLGGIDGLLHVTDMSWRRVSHPSQVLNVGDTVQVKVIRINPETQRISLGMKQLQDDPWNAAAAKYTPGTRHTGRVTNIADYGAFIELEEGVEGLVHVSEMSWTKKNVHPGKIVSTSQEVEVEILDVDEEKRRISLGLKQVQANPWDSFTDRFPVGSTISGEVKSVTEFGLFIGLEDDIDGMAHLSDLSWEKSGEEALKDYKKGDMVEAKILEVDVEKERISLGLKQLERDTMPAGAKSFGKGNVVTCTVTNVQPAGLDVSFGEEDNLVAAFIRKGDLSRDRSEQRPERFAVGDKVDAMITRVDRKTRQYGLSIKALEINQEKEAVAQYGSSDSGASLGDILGAALKDQD